MLTEADPIPFEFTTDMMDIKKFDRIVDCLDWMNKNKHPLVKMRHFDFNFRITNSKAWLIEATDLRSYRSAYIKSFPGDNKYAHV